MKKNIIIGYISIFAVFICAIHIIFFACRNFVDTGNYENRPLYECPSFNAQTFKTFGREFENYYNDHIPFRNQLIALNNRINYYLFDSTTGDQVLLGKDGWLFIKDKAQGNAIANYTGEDLLTEEELAIIADNIVNNRNYVESIGSDFVLCIVPNKSRIYFEYMPDYLGEPAAEYAVKQIVDYLAANTDVRVVYNYDVLMNAREKIKTDGVLLYHKCDTHWNKLGAYVGTSNLLEAIGVSVPSVTDGNITIEAVPNEEADLAGMLHMRSDFVDSEVDYLIKGYDENNVEKVQDNYNEVIEYVSDADDKRTLYVCRDSFATSMGDYLGACVARTYMRHRNTYSGADFEQVKPDVFVYEIGERSAVYELTNMCLWK